MMKIHPTIRFPFSYVVEKGTFDVFFLRCSSAYLRRRLRRALKRLVRSLDGAFTVYTVDYDGRKAHIAFHLKSNTRKSTSESLQPFYTRYFEYGNGSAGYATDYGWSEDIREIKQGSLSDYFSDPPEKVSTQKDLEAVFFRWLGDNLFDFDEVDFCALLWEDQEDFE